MTLRDYQTAAAAAILRALSERREARPVAVLPTGAGKSLVLAEVARAAVQDWHGRVLVLAHVKELLQQNAGKLRALLLPSVAVGIHSAGLKRRDTDEPVVVAGVQSAVRRAGEFGKINLAIVDEAHLIPPDGEGQYRTLLDALREANPALRVAGFTATPFRLGHGLIYGGENNIFTEKCYEIGVRELIERGFLSPLTSRTHDAGAKLAGLHMRGGEFVAEEAEAAMRAAGVTDRIADDAAKRANGRKAALVFAAGVDHARELADALAAASGERAEVLTGATPPDARAALLAAFRGEIATDLFSEATERPLKWLVNVGVLPTGFDAPCWRARRRARASTCRWSGGASAARRRRARRTASCSTTATTSCGTVRWTRRRRSRAAVRARGRSRGSAARSAKRPCRAGRSSATPAATSGRRARRGRRTRGLRARQAAGRSSPAKRRSPWTRSTR